MYSKDSPLNNIQNLSERKRAACLQAKLSDKDPEMIKIMDLQHEEVNKLIFAYLAEFQNHNKYLKLCSDQQLFWDIQKILLSPIGVEDEDKIMEKYKKRGDLSKTADEVLTRINKLFSDIFAHEDTQEMAQTVIATQMLRPEDRARLKENVSAN
ncbi:MAG TPA: hypothetical protein VL443_24310 [Cyclobacteriaceae bacterium]|nr:hypothetical protein [Cyclobacteriaceae bacterium]